MESGGDDPRISGAAGSHAAVAVMGQIYMQRRRRPDPSPEQVEEWMNDPVIETGIPFGPGGLLRAAGNIPGVVRRLFKGGKPSTEKTSVLKEVVLGDKPAKISRRGFFSVPFQTAVDIPQVLREIGISEESIRSGDEIGAWPVRGSWLEEKSYLDPDAADRLQEIINEKIVRTGYRPKSYEGPGGLIRDFETMMRVYRDQALKDAAEKAGRSFDEQVRLEQEKEDKPGVVAKTAGKIRRRFGR